MAIVFLFSFAVNKDIVEVHQDVLVQHIGEQSVHGCLKDRRGIRKTKRQDFKLIFADVCVKSSLVNIIRV